MTTKQEFNLFIEQLLVHAIDEFRTTEEYKLLNEKTSKMYHDCESMFTKDQQEFADECFDILLDVEGQQKQYIYHKGLKDCVWLLKNLGVLA